MADSVTQEREEWRELVASPGWARFVGRVHEEWNGLMYAKHTEALADRPDDTDALNKLRQLVAAKRAVEKILDIPGEQIAKLTRIETGQPVELFSRRGPL